MKRCSGVLLPIFSLPSPYGIGTLGKAAYDWIDFLHEAGQQLWQVLPIGPTSFGDSPYQSFSAFAGNPYFIDLEQLCEDGLLQKEDCAPLADQADSAAIDYAKQYQYRYAILKKAYSRFDNPNEISRFRKAHNWVDDYALFMALKDSYNGLAWTQWPSAIRKRERHALEKARQELQSEVDFYVFLQLLFYTQWKKLAAYARAHNVKIIGDIPIYVALDSADAWANPELFLLDEEDRPVLVAGCPPDAFTADGQLWGNPLYRWDLMQETGFQWWKERLSGSFELYDCLRIDHFRGFESYYAIPYLTPSSNALPLVNRHQAFLSSTHEFSLLLFSTRFARCLNLTLFTGYPTGIAGGSQIHFGIACMHVSRIHATYLHLHLHLHRHRRQNKDTYFR